MDDWVEIPAGSFRLGITPDEAKLLAEVSARAVMARPSDDLGEQLDRQAKAGNPEWVERLLLDLYPAHEVDLPAFAIAARRVANAEYLRFVKETGAREPRGWREAGNREPRRAVLGLSWEEAAAYAAWAGARLPTDAEWERAARGAERRLFPWGNDYGPQGALLDDEDYYTSWIPGSRPSLSTPEGIADLVTRRWEWCADDLLPHPGANADRWRQVIGPPGAGWRARRGGETPELVACAVGRRRGLLAGKENLDTGFRLARGASPAGARDAIDSFERDVLDAAYTEMAGPAAFREEFSHRVVRGGDDELLAALRGGEPAMSPAFVAEYRESLMRAGDARAGRIAFALVYRGDTASAVSACYLAYDGAIHRFAGAPRPLAEWKREHVLNEWLDRFFWCKAHAHQRSKPPGL